MKKTNNHFLNTSRLSRGLRGWRELKKQICRHRQTHDDGGGLVEDDLN